MRGKSRENIGITRVVLRHDDKDYVVAIKPSGLLSEEGEGSFPAALKEHFSVQGTPCPIFKTALFWAFFRTIFYGLNILSSRRLSSILGIFYAIILKDGINAPSTD